VLGTVAENGISVLVCKQKEKAEKNLTKRRQKKISVPGEVCGDYDYDCDDHYDIKHNGRLQQKPTNQNHSQIDITFCRPVRARVSARIRVLWFCTGTGLAVASSATGTTEYLKY